MLMSQLQSGNVEDLKDFLKEEIEEGTYMVPEASALLGRVEAISPQIKEKESIMESLKQAKKEAQEQINKPKDIIKDKAVGYDDI